MTDKNEKPRMGMSTKEAMARIRRLIQERNAKEAETKKEND